MSIVVCSDVNFFLDACRYREGYKEASDRRQPAMVTLLQVKNLGPKCGLELRIGPHVLQNIAAKLAEPEVSYRGTTTRPAWSEADITEFLVFVRSVVLASGGRLDCQTVSHQQALSKYALAGAPDAEDYQMLVLARDSGATVLATLDADLLAMGSFHDVEIWSSVETRAEVSANVKRALQLV